MIIKPIPIAALCIIWFAPPNIVFCQQVGTDSKGKDIFDFYKTKSISIPISSANGSFKLNGTSQVGPGTQYFTSSNEPDSIHGVTDSSGFYYSRLDSTKFTIAKSYGINWAIEVSNLN